MKKMKRFFALFLAMAMVLGMSMTTFAAPGDEGDVAPQAATATSQKATVTVQGLKDGTQVSYVQIVKAVNVKTEGAIKGWVFTDEVPAAGIGMSLQEILNAGKAGFATDGTEEPASLINKNLTGLKLDGLDYPTEGVASAVNGKVEFSLEAGLYAIKATDPSNEYVYSYMVAAVDYNKGVLEGATLTAKGESNQVTKTIADVASDSSVAANGEVKFYVSAKYPTFATDAVGRTFMIQDTVQNGTIKADTVKIGHMVEGVFTPFAANDTKGLSVDAGYGGTNSFTVRLASNGYIEVYAGNDVTIEYTVVANSDLDSNKKLINTATSTTNNQTSQAVVEIPAVDVTITKTTEKPEGGEATPIPASATFELYRVVPGATAANDAEGIVAVEATSGTVYAKLVGEAQPTVNGVVTFKGLDATKTDAPVYYVKETVAPEGYAIEPLARPLTGAEINETPTVDPATEDNDWTTTTTYTVKSEFGEVGFNDGLNFHDTTLSSLPSTGGIGTTIFTVGGCAIMILAAGMFFVSRRRTSR